MKAIKHCFHYLQHLSYVLLCPQVWKLLPVIFPLGSLNHWLSVTSCWPEEDPRWTDTYKSLATQKGWRFMFQSICSCFRVIGNKIVPSIYTLKAHLGSEACTSPHKAYRPEKETETQNKGWNCGFFKCLNNNSTKWQVIPPTRLANIQKLVMPGIDLTSFKSHQAS